MGADPKSAKRHSSHYLAVFGSAPAKTAHEILVKLTPRVEVEY